VEGYTDVVAAHQAGFNNVVATLGTSLTEDHVRTLKYLSSNVVLAFDGDSAGLKAAFRAYEIFQARDMTVKVMELPTGEDPDSLLRAGRQKEFGDAISSAVTMSEYRIRRLIRLSPTETRDDRIELLKKAIPVLADVGSVIEREEYIAKLTPYHPQVNLGSGFAADQIRQDVRIFIETRSGVPMDDRREQSEPEPLVISSRSSYEVAERQILRALFSGDASLVNVVRSMMPLDEFPQGQVRPLIVIGYGLIDTGLLPDIKSVINNQLNDADRHTALLLLNDSEPMSQVLVEQAILYIKNRAQEKRLAALKELLSGGGADEAAMREYQRLNAELKGSKSVRYMVSG
jgi:DNA primase